MGWRGRLAALLLLAGCPAETNFFQCVEDSQCGGEGLCEPSQYCSFPDPECESGRRYGDEAAPGVASQCVPVGETSSTGLPPGTGSTASAGTETTTGPIDTTGSSETVDPLTTGSATTGSTSAGESTTTRGETSTSVGDASTSTGGACPGLTSNDCINCAITTVCALEANDCIANSECGGLFMCLPLCETEMCAAECCAEVDDVAAGLYATAAACVVEACPDVDEQLFLCQ